LRHTLVMAATGQKLAEGAAAASRDPIWA
jgi:hypothetical protein